MIVGRKRIRVSVTTRMGYCPHKMAMTRKLALFTLNGDYRIMYCTCNLVRSITKSLYLRFSHLPIKSFVQRLSTVFSKIEFLKNPQKILMACLKGGHYEEDH